MKTKLNLIIGLLFISVAAQAQQSGMNSSFSNVWSYVQLGLIFVIVITFVIGVIVVYNAKSSGNPDDFKKKLMSFIYGLIFLFVALGLVSVVKNFATSSLQGVF